MIKFSATNKWYQLASESENNIPTISAGGSQLYEDIKADARKVASLMLKVRRLNKMISTYYERLENNSYPDGCIRGYFNHCSTQTGRLSSDMQQVPGKGKAKIKQMFVTRYEN